MFPDIPLSQDIDQKLIEARWWQRWRIWRLLRQLCQPKPMVWIRLKPGAQTCPALPEQMRNAIGCVTHHDTFFEIYIAEFADGIRYLCNESDVEKVSP